MVTGAAKLVRFLIVLLVRCFLMCYTQREPLYIEIKDNLLQLVLHGCPQYLQVVSKTEVL